jgi:hypothetical protein
MDVRPRNADIDSCINGLTAPGCSSGASNSILTLLRAAIPWLSSNHGWTLATAPHRTDPGRATALAWAACRRPMTKRIVPRKGKHDDHERARRDLPIAATSWRLQLCGLSTAEAANLTAHLSGLPGVKSGWTVRQIGHILFLRSIVETDRLKP